jgi:hypothetical protein
MLNELSANALYEICRSLADRGEDYGWNVYAKGTKISDADRKRMIKDDDSATWWLEAFDAALTAYKATSGGEEWRY